MYLTTALSGVRMASLDASHETTVPSGTLVSRRTLKWMGVGNHFASRSLPPSGHFCGRQPQIFAAASPCLNFDQHLSKISLLLEVLVAGRGGAQYSDYGVVGTYFRMCKLSRKHLSKLKCVTE